MGSQPDAKMRAPSVVSLQSGDYEGVSIVTLAGDDFSVDSGVIRYALVFPLTMEEASMRNPFGIRALEAFTLPALAKVEADLITDFEVLKAMLDMLDQATPPKPEQVLKVADLITMLSARWSATEQLSFHLVRKDDGQWELSGSTVPPTVRGVRMDTRAAVNLAVAMNLAALRGISTVVARLLADPMIKRLQQPVSD